MTTLLKHKPMLEPGDHLSLDEFLRRWEGMPELKRAELLEGIVYMPSSVRADHGVADSFLGAWLFNYAAYTPGCAVQDNSTTIMGGSAPQPDDSLRILPEYGGQSWVGPDGYLHGAPELVAEASSSSASYDLGVKKDVYAKNGVKEYVVVVMREREMRHFRLIRRKFKEIGIPSDGILKSNEFPGLWLDTRALFKSDGKKVLAVLQKGLDSREHVDFADRLKRKKTD